TINDRIEEGESQLKSKKKELNEIFLNSLCIMELRRKDYPKNVEKSKDLEVFKKTLYKILDEKDHKSIFIGLSFLDKSEAINLPVLLGMGYDLCKELALEEKLIVVIPPDSKLNA